jgi:hypothetical protein
LLAESVEKAYRGFGTRLSGGWAVWTNLADGATIDDVWIA